MKVLTSGQMKEIDRRTIEEIGIPGPVLMENAGIQIFRMLETVFPQPARESIVVVAGRGNNGGDGMVVARHLFNCGADPLVLLLAAREEVRGDAALNLKVAGAIGIRIKEVRDAGVWSRERKALREATIIIDAIFGTGLTKPAAGFYARVISDINKSAAYKVAVDIPSGLSSDSFEIIGPAVKADLTVTLAAPKIAHVLPPAEEWVGDLAVGDISIPRKLLEDPGLKLEFVERASLFPAFKKRKRDAHKGVYGHLLVISGSLGKTGAAIMSAKAALKMGAGLVTIGTPASCLPIVARSMPELMTEPLPETKEKTVAAEAVASVLGLIKGKNAVLIGPGLSTNASTREFVWKLLPRLKLPVVIDADGLNNISLKPELLNKLPKPAILTPHPGEFGRLVGLPIPEVLKGRLELAPAFAQKYGLYLILKGYRTLVADPEGRVFINSTGNPGMATGGSGDVLSGLLASMLIQLRDPLRASIAAVYVHGLSGDLAAQKLSEKALVAGDLIRFLPPALKMMEEESEAQIIS
jgi:hydroxyethylthiazole kinase-like uncharacterized protein yjeF